MLDQAMQQLFSATKTEAKKEGRLAGRVQLRKEGYSERFIEKVEKA